MKTQRLEIKAAIQILKPVSEVFEAIVDPEKMTNYFISKSTGRMEEGKMLTWRFPEFDMQFPVRVGKIRKDRYVSFNWGERGDETFVEITLAAFERGATVVTVTEKDRKNNDAGIAWLQGNTEGWANFLACMKAYVEHGINLREGAFDFRKEEFAEKFDRY